MQSIQVAVYEQGETEREIDKRTSKWSRRKENMSETATALSGLSYIRAEIISRRLILLP